MQIFLPTPEMKKQILFSRSKEPNAMVCTECFLEGNVYRMFYGPTFFGVSELSFSNGIRLKKAET